MCSKFMNTGKSIQNRLVDTPTKEIGRDLGRCGACPGSGDFGSEEHL